MALTDKLTAIANAIRSKDGQSGKMTLAQMPTRIANIPTGGGGEPFEYSGINAVKVAEYEESWTLSDTSFVIGSSASTSAISIKSSISNRFTNTTGSPNYAYGDKDIIIIQRYYCSPQHGSGAVNKALQRSYAGVYISWLSKRKTSDTSAKSTRQIYNLTTYMNEYYNTSGTVTRATSNYGFYMTPAAPTVYSSTAATTYVRASSPSLYYRVSSSYESADNIKTVTDCIFDWKVEIYTVDPYSNVVGNANDDIDGMLLNGLIDHTPPSDDITDITFYIDDQPLTITADMIRFAIDNNDDVLLMAGVYGTEYQNLLRDAPSGSIPWFAISYICNFYSFEEFPDYPYPFIVSVDDSEDGSVYGTRNSDGYEDMIADTVNYSYVEKWGMVNDGDRFILEWGG